MNRELGQNVHMWNSALVETFMAHNNSINTFMMGPMIFFCLVLTIMCISYTYDIFRQMGFLCLFAIYWSILGISIIIIFVPFLQNEKVRKETENEERVIEKYSIYLAKRKNLNFRYKDIDEKN